MLEKIHVTHNSAVKSGRRQELEDAFCGRLFREWGSGWGVRIKACLVTSVGSFPGPLCEQHMGVRERHVSRQPLRPVLLPARLGTDADSHCCGPPPGEGTNFQCPVLPSLPLFSTGAVRALKTVF